MRTLTRSCVSARSSTKSSIPPISCLCACSFFSYYLGWPGLIFAPVCSHSPLTSSHLAAPTLPPNPDTRIRICKHTHKHEGIPRGTGGELGGGKHEGEMDARSRARLLDCACSHTRACAHDCACSLAQAWARVVHVRSLESGIAVHPHSRVSACLSVCARLCVPARSSTRTHSHSCAPT